VDASSPVRTVTIAQSWPDDRPGGANRYAADLHAALPGAGVLDQLVVFGPAAAADTATHRSGDEDASMFRRLTRTASAARWAGREAELVATHFALYGLLPAATPPLRALPLVAHFHGPWAEESRAQGGRGPSLLLKGQVERLHVRRSDAVITASRAFADVLMRLHGLPADRVHPVHPGVDLQRFSPLPADERAALRERLGIRPGEHLVVTARRLVPRMGLEQFVAAWEGSGARLVVIGDGPLRPVLQQVADQRPEAGISLLGRVSDTELVSWYRAADLVVVPSASLEGFGLVVLEALACGTPVLASDVGGLGEVLSELDPDLLLGSTDTTAWRTRTSAGAASDLPERAECRAFAERHGALGFAQAVAQVYKELARG